MDFQTLTTVNDGREKKRPSIQSKSLDSLRAAKYKPNVLAATYRLSFKPKRSSNDQTVIRLKKTNPVPDIEKTEEEDDLEEVKRREAEANKARRFTNFDLDKYYFSDEEDEDDHYQCHDDESGQKVYLAACKDLSITPMKHFYNQLDTEKVSIIGIVLKKKDAKACAIALLKNDAVETLHLESNALSGQIAAYFADVLLKNEYLTEVRITENNLKTDGAKAICDAMKINSTVRILDLSGNDFCEEDAVYFKEMMDENHALRELYLGHNKFRERGGEIFADGLATNDFLRVLDLRWNHLRLEGATAIGKALQKNRHLEKLNISWNGFYVRGVVTIAKALETNTTLLQLDLGCNRLSDPCIDLLIRGLDKNSTLKVLRLAKNQMYPAGALRLLECIDRQPSRSLELLDLGDQCVTDAFETLLFQMKQNRDIKVIYGMVWNSDREVLGTHDDDEDELNLIDEDPLTVLMEYARLQNFRLLDMFKILDTDGSGSLSLDEFKDGLERVNIPIRKKALTVLIKKMDIDGDGEIDFGELMKAQKDHKEKVKTYMRGEVPIEETEIGRIDKSLRIIMNKRYLMNKRTHFNLIKPDDDAKDFGLEERRDAIGGWVLSPKSSKSQN